MNTISTAVSTNPVTTSKQDTPSSQGLSARGINDESLEHMKYIEKQLTSTPATLADEKLTISEEALSLFRQNPTEKSDTASAQETANDKVLEQIKEQIEAVKKQLSRIKNDKGEEAEQQRRQLQVQLATLSASMLDLLGKKLDAI
ncbi:hypothetical protein EKO29_14280 [Colwellia sp. Arc7-635]|uniref:hypothetical protein n=1 Tax=Colwellia sp. Arc7-635 TaxID=2497879 RepID=UPI000F859B0E|nr:hypothetical protein [Colwellia sp. Arc7-635]AZQ85044.1 hypothetical protein EKO29_14280 [Colwellia sp. Arc7-635]